MRRSKSTQERSLPRQQSNNKEGIDIADKSEKDDEAPDPSTKNKKNGQQIRSEQNNIKNKKTLVKIKKDRISSLDALKPPLFETKSKS